MKYVFTVLCFYFSQMTFAQFPIVTEYNACNEAYNGSVNIFFTNDIITYPLPYELKHYNIRTNDFEEIVVDENPFTLSNLAHGEYEFSVNISSTDIIEFCAEIMKTELSESNISTETSSSSCSNNDGTIILDIINFDDNLITFPVTVQLFNATNYNVFEFDLEFLPFENHGLSSGDYIMELSILDGCSISKEFKIELNKIEIQFEKTPACDDNGTIESTVFGGEPPYSFVWLDNENETSSSRTGLNSKFYTLVHHAESLLPLNL